MRRKFSVGPVRRRPGAGETDEELDDAQFLVLPKRHRRRFIRRLTGEARTRNMEIKIKGLVRRQMVYGFAAEKDGEGQVIGASVVKLARRNAFEMVGLKRPVPVPHWRWNVS